MKCSDLQFNLSLYGDGFLSEGEASSIQKHLEECPLCRQKNADHHDIKEGLIRLPRLEVPHQLTTSLKRSLRSQIIRERRSWLPVSADIREWLKLRVMPYSVGVTASVVIGLAFLTMMFSGIQRSSIAHSGDADTARMIAANRDRDSTYISPNDFARTRMAFGSESPSVNPQGALIALTKSLIRGGMKDDEVVVVADVFGNGLAQITQVVEPSNDKQAVDELEKALETDLANSPFVPTVVENRPENVRVVLRFQSVNVSTGLKPEKPKK